MGEVGWRKVSDESAHGIVPDTEKEAGGTNETREAHRGKNGEQRDSDRGTRQ